MPLNQQANKYIINVCSPIFSSALGISNQCSGKKNRSHLNYIFKFLATKNDYFHVVTTSWHFLFLSFFSSFLPIFYIITFLFKQSLRDFHLYWIWPFNLHNASIGIHGWVSVYIDHCSLTVLSPSFHPCETQRNCRKMMMWWIRHSCQWHSH